MSVDVVTGRTAVFDEVQRARLRARWAKAAPKFVTVECPRCGHRGVLRRATLLERRLTCSKCHTVGVPRSVTEWQ